MLRTSFEGAIVIIQEVLIEHQLIAFHWARIINLIFRALLKKRCELTPQQPYKSVSSRWFSLVEASQCLPSLFMGWHVTIVSQKIIIYQSLLLRISINVPETMPSFSFQEFSITSPFPSCLQKDAVTLGNCVLTWNHYVFLKPLLQFCSFSYCLPSPDTLPSDEAPFPIQFLNSITQISNVVLKDKPHTKTQISFLTLKCFIPETITLWINCLL